MILIGICTCIPALAFRYDITVKLPAATGGKVTLYTSLNSEIRELRPDSSGKIYFSGDLMFPSQCMLAFEFRKNTYRYNFYLFNDSRITAGFDPGRKGNEWLLEGLCARCKAFEKIAALSNACAAAINDVNYESQLQKFSTSVKNITGIGTDEYTQLAIDMEVLKLKERIINPRTGKILFNTGNDPVLKKYLPPKDKYCGFSLYTTYISNQFLTQLYDSVIKARIKDGSIPEPVFLDVHRAVAAQKNQIPAKIYAEMMLQLLYANRDPSFKDSLTVEMIKKELTSFLQNYPHHAQLNLVQRINDCYQRPLLKNPVPNIWLLDRKGIKVPTKAFQSKYVIVNTWSLYNRTSRSLCDTLEQIVNWFNQDKKWIYLAHVALDADLKKWINTAPVDSLPGNQFISMNNDFEKAFQLWDFPTAYIINPKGIVIYKGHPYSLTRPFLDKVLSGKLD